jgi:aldehyde:ferredoxin oxidoreductase
MPNGYCEKIVRVDLTRRIVRDQELDQRLVKNFLGGTGAAAKILFDEVPPGISAFDPANKLLSWRSRTSFDVGSAVSMSRECLMLGKEWEKRKMFCLIDLPTSH